MAVSVCPPLATALSAAHVQREVSGRRNMGVAGGGEIGVTLTTMARSEEAKVEKLLP